MNSQLTGVDFNYAYDNGYEAYQNGLAENVCIYEEGTQQYKSWHEGYNEAELHEQEFSEEDPIAEYLVIGLLVTIIVSIGSILFAIY